MTEATENSFPENKSFSPEQEQRLDAFVAQTFCLSRAQARQLLAMDHIRVNGQTCRLKGHILTTGDQVQITEGALTRLLRLEPNASLTVPVLYQDETLLLVDKPAGLPVHPLNPTQTQTVLNALIHHYPQIQGIGEGELRSGVIHRLDVSTSGVLAVALTQTSWKAWRNAFAQHHVVKTYHALVQGHPPAEGVCCQSLKIVQHRPAKVRVVKPGTPQARPCRLSWRVMEKLNQAAWVQIHLETGFLHQVRVMFEFMGFPLLGDPLYGTEASCGRAGRPMLHAASLKWNNLAAHSDWPRDFSEVYASL